MPDEKALAPNLPQEQTGYIHGPSLVPPVEVDLEELGNAVWGAVSLGSSVHVRLDYAAGDRRLWVHAKEGGCYVTRSVACFEGGYDDWSVQVGKEEVMNALVMLRDSNRRVRIGLNQTGFWVGRYLVPYRGGPDDHYEFPRVGQAEWVTLLPIDLVKKASRVFRGDVVLVPGQSWWACPSQGSLLLMRTFPLNVARKRSSTKEPVGFTLSAAAMGVLANGWHEGGLVPVRVL